jgi:hypothetical protein
VNVDEISSKFEGEFFENKQSDLYLDQLANNSENEEEDQIIYRH